MVPDVYPDLVFILFIKPFAVLGVPALKVVDETEFQSPDANEEQLLNKDHELLDEI